MFMAMSSCSLWFAISQCGCSGKCRLFYLVPLSGCVKCIKFGILARTIWVLCVTLCIAVITNVSWSPLWGWDGLPRCSSPPHTQALTGIEMRNIPLGSIESKFYEVNGEKYYEISSIPGLQTKVWGKFNLAKAVLLEHNEQFLIFKQGSSKIKMAFKQCSTSLQKVQVTKYIMGIIPVGVQFCEISVANKNFLLEQFKAS